MKKLVIIPGGFHPYHAGHKALYDAAREAFPSADVYVAATDDRSERPFPFEVKKKLARLAGIPAHRFIQVRSPFNPVEITDQYPADDTQLIFVKSLKNAKGGSDPEGPFPAEPDPKTGELPLVTRGRNKGKPVSDKLQYYRRNGLAPMNRHIYLHYLPVKEFGGMTSASEIRAKWQKFHDAGNNDAKANMVHILYPNTVGDDKLTDITVKLIDAGMGLGSTAPKKEPAVREATVRRDPEQGVVIAPTDTQQEIPEDLLVRDVARQLTEVVQSLRSGQYRNVEHLLYGAGGLENRIRALARYQDYEDRLAGKNMPQDRSIDIGESDYIEEKLSQLATPR